MTKTFSALKVFGGAGAVECCRTSDAQFLRKWEICVVVFYDVMQGDTSSNDATGASLRSRRHGGGAAEVDDQAFQYGQ